MPLHFPRLLPAILLATFSLPLSRAQQSPATSPASQPAPFQVLTDTQEIGVAPDGRLWTSTTPTGAAMPTLDTVRKELAEQFNLSPRKFSFAPALIEPTGRIWAYAIHRQITKIEVPNRPPRETATSITTLVAFDGKDFIEHPIPMLGANYSSKLGPPAVFFEGTAYFSFYLVIYSFDGKTWSEQQIGQRPTGPPRLALVPEFGGKGLLAIGLKSSDIWLLRRGKWSRFAGPAYPSNDSSIQIEEMAVLPSGLLLKPPTKIKNTAPQVLSAPARILALTTPYDPSTQWLNDLSSADATTRATAARVLIAHGKSAVPAIDARLAAPAPEDLKKQLTAIREQSQLPANDSGTLFGHFKIKNIKLLVPLPDGSLLLIAGVARDASQPTDTLPPATPESPKSTRPPQSVYAPCVILIAPDMTTTLVGGRDLADHLINGPTFAAFDASLFACVVDHGKAVWIMNSDAPRPVLFDISTHKIRTEFYGPTGELFAATDDGLLYFRERIDRVVRVTAWNASSSLTEK